MTTRLAGKDTVFLPFNRGCERRQGEPANPIGYKTAYLWEEVWQRDRLLDILARFVHLVVEEKKVGGRNVTTESMIFPRYHQLDAVRRLVAAAKPARGGAELPRPALGRERQEQHHRLAGPPALQPPRGGRPEGLRLGRRRDRPEGPRHAAPGHDLPVRAQAGRRGQDRRELGPARRGAEAGHAGSSSRRSRSSRSSRTRSASSPSGGTRSSWTRPTARRRARPPGNLREVLAATSLEAAAEEESGRGEDDREDRIAQAMAARGKQPNLSLLRLHRDAEGQDARAVRQHRGRREARALPPLLDAAGDRGGLHPRRARELHDLQDVLPAGEGRRGRPRGTTRARRASALARFVDAAPAQPRAEGRGHRRALPRSRSATRSAARPRRWSSPRSRLHAVRYKQAIDTYIAEKGYTRHRGAGRVLRAR